MRFIVIVKANKDFEAGILPTQEELAQMGKFNDELVKAGVMLAGEGLHASSKGTRISYDGKKRTVRDGPFTETKELVADFTCQIQKPATSSLVSVNGPSRTVRFLPS